MPEDVTSEVHRAIVTLRHRLVLALLVAVLLAVGCASANARRPPNVLEQMAVGGVTLDVVHDAATDVRWFHVEGLAVPGPPGASDLGAVAIARINRALDRAAALIMRAVRRHPEDPGAAAFFVGFVTPRWLLFEVCSAGHGYRPPRCHALLGFDGRTGRRLRFDDRQGTLTAIRASLGPDETPTFDRFVASLDPG